jgi:hypothetical protein
MREYGFTITEHDPDRPWMVLSGEHRTIKLPDGMDFFTWAREQWPAPRWSVQAAEQISSGRWTATRHSLEAEEISPENQDESA